MNKRMREVPLGALMAAVEIMDADFDSAIPRFESWRPSQPARSPPGHFRVGEKPRHFRRLDPVSRVSGAQGVGTWCEIGRFLCAGLCSCLSNFRFRHPKTGSRTGRDRLWTAMRDLYGSLALMQSERKTRDCGDDE